MGADLLTAVLWSERKAEGPQNLFDWEAGLLVAKQLPVEDCLALVEFMCEEDMPVEEVRQLAVAQVTTLQQHLTGFSRDLNVVQSPDGRWTGWITGGLSWGDSPSELFDAMSNVYAMPRVLAALGFWTGEEVWL